jgi:hypothetical protein
VCGIGEFPRFDISKEEREAGCVEREERGVGFLCVMLSSAARGQRG